MSIFAGFSAFPLTPVHADGGIDLAALAVLIERCIGAGADSIGLLGSTGTFAYLSRAERARAVEAAVAAVDGRVPLIVGIGALAETDVHDLAKDAEMLGADGLLLGPVSYTPLTDAEVTGLYARVAASTELPLCIYNNPGTTKYRFPDAVLERLARVPGIAGVKMPLPVDGDIASEIARLRAILPREFVLGYSGDWGCGAAMLAGADAFYSSIGGTLVAEMRALFEAGKVGDEAEVARLEAAWAELWALFPECGGLRVSHWAARYEGLITTDLPRPLLSLPPEAAKAAESALAHLRAHMAG